MAPSGLYARLCHAFLVKHSGACLVGNIADTDASS